MERIDRMAALEFYYDQTHPFCFMAFETRGDLPSIITPVQPSTTIADTTLLSEADTRREIDALYLLPNADDIAGMSLLQMSPEVQNHITETGQWPEDGVGVPGMLGEDLVNDVLDYRLNFYRMNKVGEKLAEANAHMVCVLLVLQLPPFQILLLKPTVSAAVLRPVPVMPIAVLEAVLVRPIAMLKAVPVMSIPRRLPEQLFEFKW